MTFIEWKRRGSVLGRRFTAWLVLSLFVSISMATLALPLKTEAAVNKLSLERAQKMAAANSETYRKIQNKIELQEIKYATAVKSIKMKKKNLSTFRWTPLLSFKFPEKPTLADEYEWQYKPLQISCTIQELKHQLEDDRLASREKVTQVFVETYICQEKISFYEMLLSEAQDTLQRNRIRLASGEAKQSDVDKMQQKVSRLTTDVALQMRTFENQKSELTKLIGLDVTSGYIFLEPLVDADIPRDVLDDLVEHTLAHDHEYYDVKLETQLSLRSLNMLRSMMEDKYGRKLASVQPFIQQALNGENIDSAAFKKVYNQMLDDIDAPWEGKYKILFFRFPKEWFKGSVDGSRYVEDDPYVLYTAALEYADAAREQSSAEETLVKQVRNDFETIKTAQIAYTDAARALDALSEDLDKGVQRNRIGSMSYEELADIQTAYEEQELSKLSLLGEYSKLLYAYDRLTCGAVTAYLEGTDIDMAAAQGGNSFLADEMKGTAYYYIEYAVEENVFRLGVSIPEDFSVEITHFELYVDEEKIGDRTEKDKYLEHLGLDLDNTGSVKLYLYKEENLVDVCEIDPSVYQDVLEITGGYTLVKNTQIKTVATYDYVLDSSTNTVLLTIKAEKSEPIAYYRLEDKNGNAVSGETLIDIDSGFRYLSLLVGDFTDVAAVFYDQSESLLYKGTFETGIARIVVEQGADINAE
ncbi:MAG: TolC family protein [Lachnospiraceae bacterium]|nr:TolC family protein [Lachnospiraceae bacterium]